MFFACTKWKVSWLTFWLLTVAFSQSFRNFCKQSETFPIFEEGREYLRKWRIVAFSWRRRKMSRRQICSRSARRAASFHKTPHLWHKRPVVHAHAVTLHKICASLDRAENKLVAIRHVRSWRYARCHLTWFPSARSAARRPSQLECLACFFRDKSLPCDREIIRGINETGATRSKQTHVSSVRKRNPIFYDILDHRLLITSYSTFSSKKKRGV